MGCKAQSPVFYERYFSIRLRKLHLLDVIPSLPLSKHRNFWKKSTSLAKAYCGTKPRDEAAVQLNKNTILDPCNISTDTSGDVLF